MIFPALAILAFNAAASATVQSPPSTAEARVAHEPTITSEIFVDQAIMAGLFEVEAGKLALSRSKNPDVTAFAHRMVTEHTAAGVELSKLVSGKKPAHPVPVLLDADHQEKLKKLQKLSGKDFDGAYGQSMREGHDDALRTFTLASSETLVDADLRAFASKFLPTLQSHHDLARKLPMAQRE